MINRNNYEEFLLLYVDGELSPADKKAVELFIEQNPDIREELELLQQAILSPDEEISFTAKQSLYRKEAGITLNNYQEYFLLYIDNELSSSEKEAVETFVLQQPQLQDAFTLLKQTVLPQERVIFTDKASLYREEEKRRPVVISLRWASLAAAVMIGIVALLMFTNNNGEEVGPVAGGIKNGSSVTKPSTVQPAETPVVTEQPADNNIAAEVNRSSGNKTITQPLKKDEPEARMIQQPIADNNHKPEQHPAITTPFESTTTGVTNTTEPVSTLTSNAAEPGEQKFVANNTPANDNNNYAQPAVFTALEDEKDKTVYVGAMQVNPDKVRGFFRKATRFLSSKVKGNDDDGKEKVRVANMEMNKIK